MRHLGAIKRGIAESSEDQLRAYATAMLMDLLAYERVCKEYDTFRSIHSELVMNFERYLTSNVQEDSSSV